MATDVRDTGVLLPVLPLDLIVHVKQTPGIFSFTLTAIDDK